ncbi:hypothetical protein BGX29_011402 [Mortierella sp. GBA35]|nr:hypothetical protein BGX29_011402 [Mortierella sp. GBA35]
MGYFWVSSVADSSIFSSRSSSSSPSSSFSSEVAPPCGTPYSPCPVSVPCCNNGTCHKTSLQACPIALGCQPAYSYPISVSPEDKKKHKKSSSTPTSSLAVNSCFPLPVCRSFKEKWKSNKADKHGKHQALIPKSEFLGDPDQAHWTSDFDHIAADHAVVDTKHKKLVLNAKRDKVKTKSGGGFGATVSSTRWNRYGTFATQFRAGSSGPGIVTAFLLSNPALGEEISFQITGRDPKTVLTEYYKHSVATEKGGQGGKGGRQWISVPEIYWPHLPSVLPIETTTTRGRKPKDLLLHKKTRDDGQDERGQDSTKERKATKERSDTDHDHDHDDDHYDDDSLEESHPLKKSATENDLVYKIEWTPEKIEWSVDGRVLRTLRAKDLSRSHPGLEIPSQPMQIQLTIWDAGHGKDTRDWAGGVTDYGEHDEKEYVALVDWIEIACWDNKEAKRNPWPGKEASARLAQVELEERKAEEEREAQKKAKAKKDKEAQKVIDSSKPAKSQSRGWLSFGGGNTSGSDNSSESVTSKTKKQLKQEEKQKKKEEKSKLKEKQAAAREPGVLFRFLDSLIGTLLRWNFIILFLVATGSYLTEPANARKFHLTSKDKIKFEQ